jgi:protein-disulfide isomerase
LERHVEDGTLRIEWRDFAYLGQESVNAALAARAAQKQGKFWEYHDALYENQRSKNSGGFSDQRLIELARELGLDAAQFEASLTSGRFEPLVQKDLREAQDAGIQGTPTFFINDRILVGAQPLEVFEHIIEDEERKAESG